MPRQSAVSIENSFKAGHITEATGLNFPENACTDELNCVFNYDGSVTRRLGLEFESNYSTKTIDRTDSVVTTYLWRNVAGNGDVTLLVVQVGATLYFYETANSTISSGAIASTVTLTPVSGAPSPETVEAQFATGNGLLFVTHPYCSPMRVAYTTSTQTATATSISLKIRDFEGDTADANDIDTRPTATLAGLEVHHKYNLYNQGWNTTNLTTWDGAFTTMPSNCDVMWAFKNASDTFDTGTVAASQDMRGNSPAPKGHYILTLSSGDRDTASGLSGATASSTNNRRPATCAFFAGRVFYSGIPTLGFNNKIYFSQIVERSEQYAFCYQVNDPTSEDASDLLPSDGGVISLPDAGTVYKLFPVPSGLLVFAANGVWLITGSVGVGFTAVDFDRQKLSSIYTISATSFVDIGGFPAWWNAEGIYIVSAGDGGSLQVQSLTHTKIKTLYNSIPPSSKLHVRGAFNPITSVVQWMYHTDEVSTPQTQAEYERILNYNVLTGAFSVWAFPTDHDVTVNSVVVLDGTVGALTLNTVVDGSGDTVIDGSGNTVVCFTASNSSASPSFLYLVSYAEGGSYKFTLAGARSTDYLDWREYDQEGTSFSSYFITGYKLHADAIRKWQANYLQIYSRNDAPTSFYIQGIWDYANTASGTGRWSTQQLVSNDNDDYDVMTSRIKMRGHGKTLQFRVSSLDEEPFDIIGWATFETANSQP